MPDSYVEVKSLIGQGFFKRTENIRETFVNAVYLAMYFVSACLVLTVFASALKRSAFGVLLVATLIWFLIGTCLYPLLNILGAIENKGEVADFISRNGKPGLAAATHVLLTAVGMFCGYLYRPRNGIADRAAQWATERLIDARDSIVWRWSILLGIVSYLIYFQLVGFDVALMNAAAARGGDFEGFGEKDAYMFIKTVAAIGLVAQCFAAIALIEKNKIFIAAYVLLVAMAYANSISRNLLLYAAIVPVLVYLRLKPDIKKRGNGIWSYAIALALIPVALLVLKYGKVMGHFIRSYFTGDYYSLVEEVGDVNTLDMIFSNFGFQWVSVQAGIDHFNRTGLPLLTQENLFATFFGAIPSRILGFFGLDFLYYGNVKPTIACVNSEAFGYYKCTVPPLAVGYSAYLLPGAGGFLIGFIWLKMYVAVERQWMAIQGNNWRKLWIPYFLWSTVVNFFTFIPSALAIAMTQLLWVVVLSRLRPKVRLLRRPAFLS